MHKPTIAILGLVLCTSLASRAQNTEVLQQPSHREALPDDVVEVHHDHTFAGGAVVRDIFGGAIVGAAAGAGYDVYQHSQNGDWGNWQRPVLIGAAVGAGIGLIFGIVDATTWSDRGYTRTPYADKDRHEPGFAPPAAQYGLHF
jgi:hypothetical protein